MSDGRKGWLRYIDSGARLAAALAVVFAAIIASRYESRMTSISLLNQREQSESALRASMFQNLIDPIVGQPPEGKTIEADRERLLVELLTLNFHDHFEFKPLLLEVDERLRLGGEKGFQGDRDALSSTARRVIDRQINTLNAAQQIFNGQELSVDEFKYVAETPRTHSNPTNASEHECAVPSSARRAISPDGAWEVRIGILQADFLKRKVKMSLNMRPMRVDTRWQGFLRAASSGGGMWEGLDFELTQFDFPLSDYNQLDSTHRLALTLLK